MLSTQATYNRYTALAPIGYWETGYHFIGWNSNWDRTGQWFTDQQQIVNLTPEKDGRYNVFAQWEPNIYEIILNGNGGSFNGVADCRVCATYMTRQIDWGGTRYDNLPLPYRNGYIFQGYYADEIDGSNCAYYNGVIVNGSILWDEYSRYRYANNVNLYSHWEPIKYIIQFNGNGSTSGNISSMNNLEYDKAYSLNSAVNLKRTGYEFIGWNDRADGKGNSYSDGQSIANLTNINGNVITLYAQWKPIVYKIELDSQGADSNGTERYYEQYGLGNFKDKDGTSKISNIDIPKKEGFKFEGYYACVNGSGTKYIDSKGLILAKNNTFNKNTTLYAKWERPVEIVFNLNGGMYENSKDNIVLSGNIVGNGKSYKFNVDGTENSGNKENTKQSGKINIFGNGIDSNGINRTITKISYDSEGNEIEWRFLGWTLEKQKTSIKYGEQYTGEWDSNIPEMKMMQEFKDGTKQVSILDSFSGNKVKGSISVYKSVELYAVWEPVLKAKISVNRALGGKIESGWLKADTVSDSNEQIGFRTSELGNIRVYETGNIDETSIAFDPIFSNMYSSVYSNKELSKYKDTLNGNEKQSKERFNKVYNSSDKLISNSINHIFYIPTYILEYQRHLYGNENTVNRFGVKVSVINKDSYYWNTYKGRPEEVDYKLWIKVSKQVGNIGNNTDDTDKDDDKDFEVPDNEIQSDLKWILRQN